MDASEKQPFKNRQNKISGAGRRNQYKSGNIKIYDAVIIEHTGRSEDDRQRQHQSREQKAHSKSYKDSFYKLLPRLYAKRSRRHRHGKKQLIQKLKPESYIWQENDQRAGCPEQRRKAHTPAPSG